MLGIRKQNKSLAFILAFFSCNSDFFVKKCGSTAVYLFVLVSQSEIICAC